MRLVITLLLTVILAPRIASGQTAKILPPENPVAGEMVRFNAEFTGDDLDWIVFPPVRYSDAIDRQTKAYFIEFVPKPGVDYQIQLDAYKVVDGKFAKAKDVKVFRIGPKPPDPDPDPDPDPEPDPEPDNLTETAKKVRDWAKQIGNKVEAKKIAENYAGINSSIAAGAYNNIEFLAARSKIISDLYTANHPVSENNEEWNVFFRNLSSLMQSLDEAGKLGTLADLHKSLQEIQSGLEAVK